LPVLCANAVEASTGRLLALPSLVRQAGALRIGVFGLLTHDTQDYPAAREGVLVTRSCRPRAVWRARCASRLDPKKMELIKHTASK